MQPVVCISISAWKYPLIDEQNKHVVDFHNMFAYILSWVINLIYCGIYNGYIHSSKSGKVGGKVYGNDIAPRYLVSWHIQQILEKKIVFVLLIFVQWRSVLNNDTKFISPLFVF